MTEQKQNPPADECLSKAERELLGEGLAAHAMRSPAAAVQMLKIAGMCVLNDGRVHLGRVPPDRVRLDRVRLGHGRDHLGGQGQDDLRQDDLRRDRDAIRASRLDRPTQSRDARHIRTSTSRVHANR